MQPAHDRRCTVDGCGGKHKARGLCLRHYQAAWGRDNRDKTREYVRKSRAKRPEHYRTQAREADRANWSRRYLRDGERIRERQRAYRAAHPDKRRAAVLRWAEANRAKNRRRARAYAIAHPEQRRQIEARRRARKLANGAHLVTARDVARLILRQGGCCAYCPTELSEGFHLDHIVPLARGGHHAIGNLAAACPACNTSKSRSTLTEWRIRRQRM